MRLVSFPLIIAVFLSVSSVFTLKGQDAYPDSLFQSPIDYPIILGGSFAELRSSHFHAGIDIKPQGKKSIDTIRAAASGYISRIKVQTGGYGHVLYMNHPSGHTTVYAHLEIFHDSIQAYVRSIQRSVEKYAIEVFPDSTRFTFNQGEFLGLMGNTGRSYGKHLHFEIRETATEIPINPALFGLKPDDTRAPSILSMDVYEMDRNFRKIDAHTYKPKHYKDGIHKVDDGKIHLSSDWCGIGIQAYDRMDGAENKNGVYYQKVYVDDTLYYSYTLDKVSFEESRYIQSHVNYEEKKKNRRTLIQCFRHPGSTLTIYDTLVNEGLIRLHEGTPRRVKVVLGDIEQNESIIYFSLFRKRDGIPKDGNPFNLYVPFSEEKSLTIRDLSATIPAYTFDKNTFLSYQSSVDSLGRTMYHMDTDHTPAYKRIPISVPIENIQPEWWPYTCLLLENKDSYINLGGSVESGIFAGRLNTLGSFTIGIDTIAPTITSDNENKNYTGGDILVFTMKDNFVPGGDAEEIEYDVYIDGTWVVAQYKVLTERLYVPIPAYTDITEIEVKIVAKDDRGNTAHLLKKYKITP